MYVHYGEETNIRDSCSYKHYWTNSWNSTWKNFRRVRDLNPWILSFYTDRTSTVYYGRQVIPLILTKESEKIWNVHVALNSWESFDIPQYFSKRFQASYHLIKSQSILCRRTDWWQIAIFCECHMSRTLN